MPEKTKSVEFHNGLQNESRQILHTKITKSSELFQSSLTYAEVEKAYSAVFQD
jgi:hypothetical protein